jgi:hypothetical protein
MLGDTRGLSALGTAVEAHLGNDLARTAEAGSTSGWPSNSDGTELFADGRQCGRNWPQSYSWRNALVASTRVARRAGIKLANNAAAKRIGNMMAKVDCQHNVAQPRQGV